MLRALKLRQFIFKQMPPHRRKTLIIMQRRNVNNEL
ncbi:hypothetical protein SAMN05192569_104133 [Parageobacillus thermantarcticus]|uniref:Uncharacterized protein n=1 Tax=Parageobacillus thermantarcticus TaxID=186116 RepID=A0A1I0TND2_9BACL|nr:hypothetical protein SAMN05192569_104133 [Parageobacillus thermantarcticus]